MRVLAITNMYPSPELPGQGVFIEQQVQGLLSRGIDVQVMFVNRRREGPLAYYRMGRRLRQALGKFSPDVVHVMYGGVMAHQVTATRGLPPVVVTFHGSDLLGENLSGPWRKLVSHYGIHCSKKAARQAQGVIVVARHLLKALGKKATPGKIWVLPCGIDLERFRPLEQSKCRQQLGWESKYFHVLFATSAGDPVKRPELARAAVALLEQERGRVQFHLLAAVPNEEVPAWLNASDALLLTSKHEGSPTIVKEALACGLPVVSVPVGDVPERIQNIDRCYLAQPEPVDLAHKLGLIYDTRQRLDCRDKLQELSCQAVAVKLETFYDEVLSGRAATVTSPRLRLLPAR
jgi:glycosyltransferase involved in cell wall biosynthesis